MKHYKLFLYIFSILGLFMTTSCDSPAGVPEASQITYLPKITLEGDLEIELPCDATSYSDPGASASAGGQEIELNTSVSGAYFGGTSVDGPDVYSVSYQAFNADNIPAVGFRSIFWPACTGDLVTSIAGVYTSDVKRNGTISAPYQGVGPIIIKDLGAGKYQISDAIGGYYEHGRGYGPAYAATGMTVTANNIATNDFTYGSPIGVGAFGGALTMTSFTVNPVTKTIVVKSSWDAGYVFEVTLTQVP